MKKKLIIGICSYTGSDTRNVLKKLRRILPCKIYSVIQETSLENVFDQISKEKRNGVYIIDRIHSVQEMFYTERIFPENTVQFIAIDVHYEDRYKILLAKKWIKKTTPKIWHDEFHKEECEQNMKKCFERIPYDFNFKYQEGCQHQIVGEIADLFLRL